VVDAVVTLDVGPLVIKETLPMGLDVSEAIDEPSMVNSIFLPVLKLVTLISLTMYFRPP